MSERHIQQRPSHRLDASGRRQPNKTPAAAPSRVEQLNAYWQRQRRGRVMPARADIEPLEIKALLPYLLIADVFDDPVRVRYRLAGTAICDAFGYNIAGRWLDDLEVNGGVPFWIAQYARMIGSRAPVFGRATGTLAGVELIRADWALFPLSNDGRLVEQSLEIENWTKGRPTASYFDDRLTWSVTAFD
jgi:hypothetical protein